MEIYDCRDILYPISNSPGIDLDLNANGPGVVIQPDAGDTGGEIPIEEMVPAHTGGRSWEENSMAVCKMQSGPLVMKNTPDGHKQGRRLPCLLRASK